jgi:hypothetical protein
MRSNFRPLRCFIGAALVASTSNPMAIALNWRLRSFEEIPTATQTGLSTTVQVIKKALPDQKLFQKLYQKQGRSATSEFRQNLPIRLDAVLPKWNDAAIPHPAD